jgi:Holliday junction DNA helicase RuvA
MIAKLSGVLDSVGEDWAVVDVAGVGYLVFASGRTLRGLGGAGARLSLLVETHVREDHIHLYGFADAVERDWFRLLTTVQGVGARLALAVLTALAPEEIADAILTEDKKALTRAAGVGPKLAARLVTELKDRAAAMASPVLRLRDRLAADPREAVDREGRTAVAADAVSALVNLGYRHGEAYTAIAAALRRLGGEAPLDAVIKTGLQELHG